MTTTKRGRKYMAMNGGYVWLDWRKAKRMYRKKKAYYAYTLLQ